MSVNQSLKAFLQPGEAENLMAIYGLPDRMIEGGLQKQR
jgi:hypothetical protein